MKKEEKHHKKKKRKMEKLDSGSHREEKNGKGRMDLLPSRALIEVSKQLERGSLKYGAKDWLKGGIPQSNLLDSTIRHLLQYMSKQNDEDHLVASATNILQMIEQEELIKEGKLNKKLNDI